LQISINAVQSHLNNHLGDKLGACNSGCDLSRPHLTTDKEHELEDVDFILYPNPADTEINLHLHGYDSDSDLKLLDHMGKVIWKMQMINDNHMLNIDLTDQKFVNGIYFIQATKDGQSTTKRFVILK
jgi:hypothetical protein